jgi:homogentisate 1,2-dioxygenase
MSKSVELHAEIVENDAGDLVMRLKDYEKGAISFHRASGASGPKAYKKLKAILEQAPPKRTVGG